MLYLFIHLSMSQINIDKTLIDNPTTAYEDEPEPEPKPEPEPYKINFMLMTQNNFITSDNTSSMLLLWYYNKTAAIIKYVIAMVL